ncbi:hypothetical protein [Thalassococcus lentus]|uniref:Tetratricopeptide repeat-like domain-containing protein n=1 Tax=Thalassococcus lentus TaxID=1210524 RepID=A0ABT4XX57_9RHOB|nr:hypothetical protein [Thalassococcus lentus]MDA7426555.1 hypothetical protein [Thalassococcus lentus]
MSDTDSFIEEVTEEVRRDRLFATMRKYGWIAILAVVLIVGGAAWREYSKAQTEARAQAFGDSILSALEGEDEAARIDALNAIEAPSSDGNAILQLLIAAEEGSAGRDGDSVARLKAVSDNAEVPQIYRQIASFKALTRTDGGLSADERRAGLEALAIPGQPLRVLAEEQLALLDIETGNAEAALERLIQLSQDSEATAGLRRRASQLIVALGGEPQSG